MIRGWVWAWSLSALLASQRTVAQIQLDINDPGRSAFGCIAQAIGRLVTDESSPHK